ncbi:MAG: Ralstonia phage RsoP1IDN, partial [Pseudomonadota bacterium]
CSTTHCRAGWAVALAGDAGRALEAATRGTASAAYLIYAASDPARPVVDFYTTREKALADMKRRAKESAP